MNQRSCGCWEPNLGPLKERKSLLMTETHIQAQIQFYYEGRWFLFVLFKNIFNSADLWSCRKLQSCCRGVMHLHHSPFPKGHTFHKCRTVSTLGIQHCYFIILCHFPLVQHICIETTAARISPISVPWISSSHQHCIVLFNILSIEVIIHSDQRQLKGRKGFVSSYTYSPPVRGIKTRT